MRIPTPADVFGPPGGRGVVLTRHARERAVSMGVPIHVVRAIVADPDRTYPGARTSRGTPTTCALSRRHPGWMVVYVEGAAALPHTVVTVSFDTDRQQYRRVGGGFELLDEEQAEMVRRWC